MAKFILIDHSIIGVGGHHYEYAVRVLNAAKKAGFEPTLAANRNCGPVSSEQFAVERVYRQGFWPREGEGRLLRAIQKVNKRIRKLIFTTKASLMYSRLGLLWAIQNKPEEILWRSQALSRDQRLGILEILILYTLVLVGAAVRLVKTTIPFKIYWKLLFREINCLLRVALSPIVIVNKPPEWMRWQIFRRMKSRSFGTDTVRLFKRLRLQEGDLVFIPTLDEAELTGLLRYLRRGKNSSSATWLLLFRRNIYIGRDPEYGRQDEDLRSLRGAFDYFERNLTGQGVFTFTDTESLTVQYNRLGTRQFHTLPIPADSGLISAGNDRAPHEFLRIVYLGDARHEKGYQHLARVVYDLWPEYVNKGRMKFTFQSNFATLKGDASAHVARAQLQALPSDKVELLLSPLSSAEYAKLVLRADVILVPYDRDNYYARSSGIFAEALVAGKPIVVPAGTWMARQITLPVFDYHEELRNSGDVVREIVGREVRWHVDGKPKSRVAGEGTITLTSEVAVYCWLAVPPSATHVLITFTQIGDAEGQFILVHAEQMRRYGDSLRKDAVAIGGGASFASALIRLDSQARRLWLGFRCAYTSHPTDITDVRITFLTGIGDVPVSSVGCVYHQVADISNCLREIAGHYPHYRASAREFSTTWAAFHSPGSLIECLMRAATGHEEYSLNSSLNSVSALRSGDRLAKAVRQGEDR